MRIMFEYMRIIMFTEMFFDSSFQVALVFANIATLHSAQVYW